MKLYTKLGKVAKNKKAMTALQTAILTGVSIAVALIVGYWIWTVVVGSIHTERLTLTLPTAEFSNNQWTIDINVTNTGPSDATIVDVRINGKSYTAWGSAVVEVKYGYLDKMKQDFKGNLLIKAGKSANFTITLKSGFSHGQTIEIAFVTASNQVYTSSVTLPEIAVIKVTEIL